MNFESLKWKPISKKTVFESMPFDIIESNSVSPNNKESCFYSLHANDWAIVVPVIKINEEEEQFLLVWQWRHGSEKISAEFPGGVIDDGETPEQAALRELTEETGYKANSIKLLSTIFPNPAIMGNKCYIFLAENLEKTKSNDFDADEFIKLEKKSIIEVCKTMGKPPFDHGLMSTALFLFMQEKNFKF